ncbi:10890_t:CDS:2, partial [Dentiscutata heterogama]
FYFDSKKEFQTSFSKSDVKSYDNTTVECNENLITNFYVDSNEEFRITISKSNMERYDNATIKYNKNLITTSLYINSNKEFQKLLMYLSKSVVASDDNITAECNENLSFYIDSNKFQIYLPKSNYNAAVEHNENLIMTSNFYFDNYEKFQTYLSKSVVESDNNTKVECNDNSPVECNDNSAEEYVENFTESIVNQNFYAKSTQESTGSSDTIHKDTININVGDTFYSWEIAETHLNQYARSARFCIHRKRVKIDNNGVVRRQTFECSFSGESIPNQVIDPTQ